jgi:hypothetical protein
MIKRSLYLITSLLVVFSMLAVASPALASRSRRSNVRGMVVALNHLTNVMTIQKSNGSKVALGFSSSTALKIHGHSAAITNLHVGDKVSMNFTPLSGSSISGEATDGQDNPGSAELEGTISAVDTTASTVTVATDEGGSTVTLNVDTTTVITLNGAPATLADLAFGDKIHAKYDSTTMLASSIEAETDVQESEVEGTISAIDTTLGTVSITPEEGGADVVLTVDTTTAIMLDDNPAALTDLQVGFQAEAKYDPTSMVASFVDAESGASGGGNILSRHP